MEINDIKTQLSLRELLQHYGLKPDRSGRLNCPFHKDRTPSLQVYYKTDTVYCFSSNCKTHGKSLDVIDFVMHRENCTKHQAINKAKELITGTASPVEDLTRSAILTRMFTYFSNGIHNSPPAREYLEQRNLDFKKLASGGSPVGYNSGQFHHAGRFNGKEFKKKEALVKSCLKVGLLLDKGLMSRTGEKAYVPFGKGGICFALRNKNDQISSLYFRSITDNKNQRHFYLKDRLGLYPKYPKSDTEKLILTESIIDAASLLQIDEIKDNYTILALYGTNGMTEEHTKVIKELKHLKEVIFFLNGDDAGRSAVKKYALVLGKEYPKLTLTHVEPAEGEDVNSLLQGHNNQLLIHLIEERKPLDPETTFSFSNELGAPAGNPSDKLTELSSSDEKEKVSNEKEVKQAQEGKKKDSLNTENPRCIVFIGDEAEYKVRGADKTQPDSMKVSLQIISREENYRDHRSKLDLYEYKQIITVSKQAGERLELSTTALEKELMHLTGLLEEWRDAYLEQKKGRSSDMEYKVKIPEGMVKRCMDFLAREDLLKQLGILIGNAGIVGEENNRLLLYIIASSYRVQEPLHGLIQGSSGSGKTRLFKVVCDMMPAEHVKKYTRVTDGSFYNQDEYFFSHKLLGFEDLDGLKEEALLAVRELQSNGILITGTSFKNESGQIRGAEKVVKGPIASLSCTTKGELYEDNQSRVFMVAVDESPEQTKRIIDYQNKKAAGLIDGRKEKELQEFSCNLIRLVKPYEVINPFAHQIHLPQKAHKIRRLNELFQSLIKQITLLHQYQRKKDERGRLISEKEDIGNAIEIMFESIVLKVDELDGSLRQFFEKLKAYVDQRSKKEAKSRKEIEFTRFQIREATGVSKTQQHHYMSQLVEMEYIRQEGFANRGYKYRINHWDNMTAIRTSIKDELQRQLQEL